MLTKRVVCGVTIVAALALLLPASAEAQGFGIKVGAAMATLREDFDLNTEIDGFRGARTFVYGFFLGVPLGGGLSLQPEFILQKRRSTLDLTALSAELGMEVEGWIEARYFEVPLLLKWQIGSGSSSPAIFVGPSFALRRSAKRVLRTGEEEAVEVDIKDTTNGTDFGVVAGAGFGFGKFSLEGRYNLGLKTFNNDPGELPLKWGTWNVFLNLSF
jgi:hypothetical protein